MSDTDDPAGSHSVEPLQLFGSDATPTPQSGSVGSPQSCSETNSQSARHRPKQPFSKSLIQKRKAVLSSDDSASVASPDSTMEPAAPPAAKKARTDDPTANSEVLADASTDNREALRGHAAVGPRNEDGADSDSSDFTQAGPSADAVKVMIVNLRDITEAAEHQELQQDEATLLSTGKEVESEKWDLKIGHKGSVGRDDITDPIHSHAKRALSNLLFRRKPTSSCWKQSVKSNYEKQCTCVGKVLCEKIQADFKNAGGNLVRCATNEDPSQLDALRTVQKKWLPVMRRLVEIALPIVQDCLSEATFYGFFAQLDPTSEEQQSNAPKYRR